MVGGLEHVLSSEFHDPVYIFQRVDIFLVSLSTDSMRDVHVSG